MNVSAQAQPSGAGEAQQRGGGATDYYICHDESEQGGAAAGDFRLRPDSPCIDMGTNLVDLITIDFAGIPRPLDGNLDGAAAFDMGAHEFDPQGIRVQITRVDPTPEGWVLRWDEAATGLRLQRATDLTNPDWVDVSGSEFTNRMALPAGSGPQFFRLVKP